jgi:hypothetical protein
MGNIFILSPDIENFIIIIIIIIIIIYSFKLFLLNSDIDLTWSRRLRWTFPHALTVRHPIFVVFFSCPDAHYVVVVFGCLLLLAPELVLYRSRFVSHFQPSEIWNRVRFRMHFSWIALYLANLGAFYHSVSIPPTSTGGGDNEMFPPPLDVLLVACFPEVIRSPGGYLGLCAVVSCVSSGLWLVTSMLVYIVGPSSIPRDPGNNGIDEFAWMLIVGATNFYRSSETIPQVMTYYNASHLIRFIYGFTAFFVHFDVAHLQPYITSTEK